MDNKDLLARLNRQLEITKSEFSSAKGVQDWAAKTLPLIKLVDPQLHLNFLANAHKFNLPLSSYTLVPALNAMKRLLEYSIEELKVRIEASEPIEEQQYFPPGSHLAIQKRISDIIRQAKNSVWIYDPYMDEKIIEELLNCKASEVKLITHQPRGIFIQRLTAAIKQFEGKCLIEARKADKSHDRFYIVDRHKVWSLGASYVDAGKKATLLIELTSEVQKHNVIKDFSEWWDIAAPLQHEFIPKRSPEKGFNFDTGDIEKRIETIASLSALKENRLLILTAYPQSHVDLNTIFSSNAGSLKSILESPPRLREYGFGLRVLDKAQIIRGQFCRVSAEGIKAVDLYKDGVLVAALRADEEFLCWAMEDLLFNPIALIESIYDFVRLYEAVLQDMKPKADKVVARMDFKRLHKDGNINKLGGRDLTRLKAIFADSIRLAPDDSWHQTINIEITDFSVSKVAYLLAEMIYLYFGLAIEEIPYTKEINDMKFIDISRIISA
jgi:hypothetical protein